jgi:hypothetical protein
MSSHNQSTELSNITGPNGGRRISWWSGVPTDSIAGYNKGCLAIDETNGKIYINTGTVSSTTWTVVGTQS